MVRRERVRAFEKGRRGDEKRREERREEERRREEKDGGERI